MALTHREAIQSKGVRSWCPTRFHRPATL